MVIISGIIGIRIEEATCYYKFKKPLYYTNSIKIKHKHHTKEEIKLIENAKNSIEKIYSDKGHNFKAIYNTSGNNAVITVRKNAPALSKGSPICIRISSSLRNIQKIN
ncbi:MAG: hypothetical protein QXZ44_00725 [Ferroplasma sp.]